MNSEFVPLAIGCLILAGLALVVAFRNVELRNNAERLEDRMRGLEPVILAAISQHNKDHALGYPVGDEQMANRIAKSVRAQLNRP